VRRLVWFWCLALILVVPPTAGAFTSVHYAGTHLSVVGDAEGDSFSAHQRSSVITDVAVGEGVITDSPPKDRCDDGACSTYVRDECTPPPDCPPAPSPSPGETPTPDPYDGYYIYSSGARSVSVSMNEGDDTVALYGFTPSFDFQTAFGFTTNVDLGNGDDSAVVGAAGTDETETWQGGEGHDTLGLAGPASIDLAGGSASFADLHAIAVGGFEDCNCAADFIGGTEGPNTFSNPATSSVSGRGGDDRLVLHFAQPASGSGAGRFDGDAGFDHLDLGESGAPFPGIPGARIDAAAGTIVTDSDGTAFLGFSGVEQLTATKYPDKLDDRTGALKVIDLGNGADTADVLNNVTQSIDCGPPGVDGIISDPGDTIIADATDTLANCDYVAQPHFTWRNVGCDAGCGPGSSYTLDGTVAVTPDPITQYHWTFDDQGAATGAKVTHDFGDLAPHQVTLELTDKNGHTGSVTATVQGCRGDSAAARRREATACPLVVNDSSDRDVADVEPCDVDTSVKGDQCTLRAAIQKANGRTGLQTIHFALPGPPVIELTRALPFIKTAVRLEGASQPGTPPGEPGVEVHGSSDYGLVVEGGGSTIDGMAINGFTSAGLWLNGGGDNRVTRSRIGLRSANGDGILVQDSARNVIGGTGTALNVISGNRDRGIAILGAGSTNNEVVGNRIGTDATGSAAVGNGRGVYVTVGERNVIGPGNIISGNLASGVEFLFAKGNTVTGNTIGTNLDGSSAILGNEGEGVWVHQNSAADVITDNVITNNGRNGVLIQKERSKNASFHTISGNFIGTDREGTLNARLGNFMNGVAVDDGDGTRISDNTFGRNAADGISLYARTKNVAITGNEIHPNGNGVLISEQASGNRVGGAGPGDGNEIAGGGLAGVRVIERAHDNAILGNSITQSGDLDKHAEELGIDLGTGDDRGVTLNDAGDRDEGGNHLQNHPVLVALVPDADGAQLEGYLGSKAVKAGQRYRIELFAVRSCDPSGFGEGEHFLKAIHSNQGVFQHIVTDVTLPAGFEAVSATATDPNGNTSEFSNCLPLGKAPRPATLRGALSADLSQVETELHRNGFGGAVTFDALTAGVLKLTGTHGRSVLLRARHRFSGPGPARIRLKRTKAASRARRIRLRASFKPRHGKRVVATRRVSLG
jgi:hypothetical protein